MEGVIAAVTKQQHLFPVSLVTNVTDNIVNSYVLQAGVAAAAAACFLLCISGSFLQTWIGIIFGLQVSIIQFIFGKEFVVEIPRAIRLKGSVSIEFLIVVFADISVSISISISMVVVVVIIIMDSDRLGSCSCPLALLLSLMEFSQAATRER